MPKKYQIISSARLIKDEASTKFHIASDDYFGTIATILDLVKQKIKKSDTKNYTAIQKTFLNLEKDLLFLQKNYYIKARTQNRPKNKNKNNKPKGKLKSQ